MIKRIYLFISLLMILFSFFEYPHKKIQSTYSPDNTINPSVYSSERWDNSCQSQTNNKQTNFKNSIIPNIKLLCSFKHKFYKMIHFVYIKDKNYFLYFSIIDSATAKPSTAEDTIPPAYPAHSQVGYIPNIFD